MKRQLETIQIREKLNDIYTYDDEGPGGANHKYLICKADATDISVFSGDALSLISFQNGPRNEYDSTEGVLDSDLLEIVRDRLKAFQAGPYANKYNEVALKHVEGALCALNARVEDRINRNVLGKYKK